MIRKGVKSDDYERPLKLSLIHIYILTQSMVDSEIKNFISAAKIHSATIEYTNIKATVVIEDGNLKDCLLYTSRCV